MERLTDNVKSEHYEVYRTLPMFVKSELLTLSGGTEAIMLHSGLFLVWVIYLLAHHGDNAPH